MMNAEKKRRIVDIGMVLLLPMLMAYSLIGELFHEIAGTLMMILMTAHIVQNRKWIVAIPKGRYTPRRIFQTALDILLMVFMVLQPLSGILMSKHLYTFIRISGISALMRQIHMVLAYWGFMLMSVHAGTHLMPMVRKVRRSPVWIKVLSTVITTVVSVYGAYAFFKRQIPEYMFLRTMFAFFDTGESRMRFLADYLTVMILFAMLGLFAAVLIPASGKKEE